MKVCQPGVEPFGLPPWCIQEELNFMFIVQGIVELLLLILLFMLISKLSRRIKGWFRRKFCKKEDLSKWEPYS